MLSTRKDLTLSFIVISREVGQIGHGGGDMEVEVLGLSLLKMPSVDSWQTILTADPKVGII